MADRSTPTPSSAVSPASLVPSRGPASGPLSVMSGRLPALHFLLEVVQHLTLNFAQSQRRERLLEEAPDAPGALPRRLDGDGRSGAGGRDGPVGDHRRVRVLLDDGVAGHVDAR